MTEEEVTIERIAEKAVVLQLCDNCLKRECRNREAITFMQKCTLYFHCLDCAKEALKIVNLSKKL